MGSSGPGRVRVERGIYRQPNGKYAVCWRHAGRLRFRTVGFDLAAARRERLALIAATREGSVPVSPRLRFETVAGWWLERFEAKVTAGERHPHAGGAPLPARPPPATGARAAADRLDHRRCRRRAAAPAAAHGPLGEDLRERASDAAERDALCASLRLDRRRPGRAARARRAPPAWAVSAHRQWSRFARGADWVFATARGTPYGHRNVSRRVLGRAAELAGLNDDGGPPLRFHDLRHTFASHLIIDLGLDPAQVSRMLGHARITITLDIYTHLFEGARHAQEIRTRMAASPFAGLLEPTTAAPSATVLKLR